ncbi:helix-turn-helix transcriptional regulator [Plantactinospora sp. KBS50]|uniref:helix-turn-helix domain-containing protein n=1 Tax=Plantactinospora sp. KBS50 TaxID=2024580 RepID=UPI000BAABF72|nr:helix-turn-helix transcriptional regulator [Plantactinospora sp. KBS50]ASW54641.1 hypothetical protein CIK06_11280 [Plantactinospora sp. KBS50]
MSNNGVPRILKYLRATHGGLTQDQLAERLSVSTSLIAKFETARLIPMPDTARRLDEVFDTGDLVQGLSRDARKTAPPDWFGPFADREREAVTLRSYEPQYVPGLLQTEAYARAVLDAGLLDESAAAEQLTVRLQRQATIRDGDRPPLMTFVLDAQALRRGDAELMKDQLVHLLDLAARSRLYVHVVPDDAGLYVGQSGPFVLATMPDGSTVAYLEDQLAGRTIIDPVQVASLVQCWDGVRSVALNHDQSQRLMSEMVNKL